eukprot:1082817-Prymnesium_polylepis.1
MMFSISSSSSMPASFSAAYSLVMNPGEGGDVDVLSFSFALGAPAGPLPFLLLRPSPTPEWRRLNQSSFVPDVGRPFAIQASRRVCRSTVSRHSMVIGCFPFFSETSN